MPVIYTKQFSNHTIIGVWHITENIEDLLSEIDLSDKDRQVLDSYRHEGRKKQWLSYRILINKLSGDTFQVHYTNFGKPYLMDDVKSKHVSITHSGDYSAVIISPDTAVGIDIEKTSKRIERVSSRFLSNSEEKFIDKTNFLEHLTICWTAKEALFKIYGNDYYDFKKQIKLQPFNYTSEGEIKASLQSGKKTVEFHVFFEKISDFFLSYVIG